jgi:formylglycine-generating enzyme required for sulfatase activity
MTARPLSHPTPDTLRALASSQLGEAEARSVLAHLEICSDCCLEMTTIGGDGVLRRLRAAETNSSGATIGQAPASGAAAEVPPELRDHAEFEVLRKLGGGGMGVVYLVRDRLTHRQEVLKVVNPYLATQPGATERFLREIRAVVQLSHPNIVTAYGALQIGGLLVLKMEHVPGENLATVVERGGPLPVANACHYAQQVAVGLHYAFGKGMVHRDIKPANLILTRDGKKHLVKILDFGLVKAMAAQGGAGDQLTGTGLGMGTPAFMAPEQAKDAARADIRADIYSLGCTLYFLLAGRPPFSGTQYDLWEAHREKTAAALNEVRKDVPAELAAVVAKMLAKAPAQRYQEPREVAQAFRPFVKAGLKSLPPPHTEEGKPGQPKAAKSVATPVRANEGRDTSDRTAKPPPRKTPAREPAARSTGRTLAVLLGVAGLLVLVGGGGAVYWTMSGTSDRGDSSTSALPPGGPGGTPLSGNTGLDGPKAAGDIVERVKNVSGIDLVPVPNGSFYMGSPEDDKDARDDEKPQHKVTIINRFYMGKYKVTRGQFQRFVDATGHKTEAEKDNDTLTWRTPGFEQTDEHPVVYVSWYDADAFCRWLAEKTGSKARLPYEAEWEYGCRAVKEAKRPTTKFCFGDDEAKLTDYAWFGKKSGGSTHPCGQKAPNAFGLYDMHGLVWELCADGKRAYQDRDEIEPRGPTSAGTPRVFRGGSYYDVAKFCRSAFRFGVCEPSTRRDRIGFRVLVSR